MSLRSNLVSEFRSHHDSRKHNSSVEEFESLTGAEFETYLAKVLREHGFEDVGGTPPTGDQGADLIARRDGHAIVMQAKRYRGFVGNRAVQEVAGAVNFYGVDEGWVISHHPRRLWPKETT